MSDDNIGRRDFLKTAAAGVLILLAEDELAAGGLIPETSPPGPPVNIGVIGLGQWGREILATLSRFDSREVEAVVIATPSHLHREVALQAIQAGKHVYCEAPLATTIEDARAIALAARGMPKLIFQAGLQGRSNALYRHVSQFVRSGVLGSSVSVAAQWNKKHSWRRPAPNPIRENEMNWRLSSKTSAGLIGEVGIHQLDLINWYLKSLPAAVTGFSSIASWNDGRDVPDTVTCIFDYPGSVRASFTSTLANSFSDSYTLFQGTNSSLMMREKRGWMVKEADSPLLGWEVYARKEARRARSQARMGRLSPRAMHSTGRCRISPAAFARGPDRLVAPQRATRRLSSRSKRTRRPGRRPSCSINQPSSN